MTLEMILAKITTEQEVELWRTLIFRPFGFVIRNEETGERKEKKIKQ